MTRLAFFMFMWLIAKAAVAGEFDPPRVFQAGSFPFSIAVGDFNEDGKLDVAVANSNLLGSGSSSVGILLGANSLSCMPAQAPREVRDT